MRNAIMWGMWLMWLRQCGGMWLNELNQSRVPVLPLLFFIH